jgi:hypothetical protein
MSDPEKNEEKSTSDSVPGTPNILEEAVIQQFLEVLARLLARRHMQEMAKNISEPATPPMKPATERIVLRPRSII